MPDPNELVRYRGGSSSGLVAATPGGKSRNLISDSSSNSNNGGEDWLTKKRVQTKTTKNIERRVQRQVVLEDGRVIEEDDPEVTVDTVEDVQSHSDDGTEDRHIVGGWGQRTYNPERALQAGKGSQEVASWHPGGNVLGEKLQRNIYTTDVKQNSYSTTSARNLGDITSKDVKKMIREGRSSRTFIKPIPEPERSVLPTKLTHKNASRRHIVDTEDVEEVQRLQDGKVKTDRYVTRECVEDDNQETSTDGSSSESESHDGDRDSFSQRKEDRYIDYYTVPRGKGIKDGKFLRHGIHLTSYDKSNKAGGIEEDSVRRPALPYKGDSDSTGDFWSAKPPKPDRPPSRTRKSSRRFSSSERERESTRSPAPPRGDFPVHYSKPMPSAQKFHTIERSSRSRKDEENTFYHSTNSGFGGGSDRRTPQPKHPHYQSPTAGRVGLRSNDSDSSYSRSRSESRGPQAPKRSSLKKTEHHHRSTGALRGDLDAERMSRLKRTMSFSGSDRNHQRRSSTGSESKSLIGSFKSLYATLTKSGKKEKENRVSAANKAWFDRDDGQGTPKRPPRKARSTASSMAGGGVSYSGYNKRQNKSTTQLNRDFGYDQRNQGGSNGGSSFDIRGVGGVNRSWEMYSSNSNLRQSPRNQSPAPLSPMKRSSGRPVSRLSTSPQVVPHSAPPVAQPPAPIMRKSSPMRRPSPSRQPEQSRRPSRQPAGPPPASPSTIAASAASMARERADRRSKMESENREPKRFEEERQVRQRGQVRSRFFGQQEDGGGDSDPDGRRLEHRPPPDMRRLLLNNVNLSRSKSMSKDLDQRPSVIKAI